jgi:hypothetical protein
VSRRFASATSQRAGPWCGSGIVLLAAVFLSLTVNEGFSSGHLRLIEFVFHSWPAMTAFTTALWLVRRGVLGSLPRMIRALATTLLLLFGTFTFFAFLDSPMVWKIVESLGVSRRRGAPIAMFAATALFVVAGAWLLIRGVFRWIGGRYQHHGVAIGFGPIYLYFRRRRGEA